MRDRLAPEAANLTLITAILVASNFMPPIGAAIVAGVGTELLADLTSRAWGRLRDQFLGERGIQNHHLQAAMRRAFQCAVANLEQQWKNSSDGIHLWRSKPEDREAIAAVFRMLEEDAAQIFSNERLGDFDGSREALQGISSDTSTTRTSFTQLLKSYFSGHDERLQRFFQENLELALNQCFAEELYRETPEGNAAWRAFQHLSFEHLRTETMILQANQYTNQEQNSVILEILARIDAWTERVAALPEQERDTAGQTVLLQAITASESRIVNTVQHESQQTRDAVTAGTDRLSNEMTEGFLSLRTETRQAAGAANQAPVMLEPPAMVHRLIGRDAELNQAMASLREQRIVLLHGLAGIGKSSLAAETARQLHQLEEVTDVVWVSARDVRSVDGICDLIGATLGNSEILKLAGAAKYAGVRTLLAQLPGALLVIDDLVNTEIGTALVQHCLPHVIRVLATSRHRNPHFSADILVPVLDSEAAIELFCDRSHLPRTIDVAVTCELLEGHPLAIVVAAGRCRVEGLPLDHLNERLRDEKLRLSSLRVAGLEMPDLSVRASLNVSWLDFDDPHRRLLTRLAACPHGATLELLSKIVRLQHADCEDQVGNLVLRSLVERDGDRLRLHVLVRDFALENAGDDRLSADTDFLLGLLEYFRQYGERPDVLPAQLLIERELANIVSATRRLAGTNDSAQQRIALALIYALILEEGLLRRRGYSVLRGDLARLGLQLTEQLGDEEWIADMALAAASALADEGRHDEALSLLHRSFAILEHGVNSERVANALVAMGNLASHLGDRETAYRYYVRSHAISTVLGRRIGIASAIGQQGYLALEAGLLAPAWRHYSLALEIYRSEQHQQGMAACFYHLGEIHARLGDVERAEELHVESLRLEQEISNLPGVVNSLDRLITLSGPSEIGAYVAQYQSILGDYEAQGNLEGTSSILQQLGDVAMRLGNNDDAEGYYDRSLELKRTIGNQRGTAVTLGQLGYLAQRVGNVQKAKELANESFELYRAIGDEDGMARCLFQLGRIAEEEGDLPLAEQLYRGCYYLSKGRPRVAAAATIAQLRVSEAHFDPEADPLASTTDTTERFEPYSNDLDRRPVELAQSYLLEETGQDDEASAAELAESLGCFPFALEIAVATMRLSNSSLNDFLTHIKARKRQPAKGTDPPEDARAVAKDSMALFFEVSDSATALGEVLRLCAFMGIAGVRIEDLAAASDELPASMTAADDLLRLFQQLADEYPLVKVENGYVRMHPLVRQAIVQSLPDDEKRIWADTAVRLVYTVFPKSIDDPQAWREFGRLGSDAMITTGHCEVLKVHSIYSATLLDTLASHFREHGLLVEALLAHEHAVVITEEVDGADSHGLARALNNFAGVLLNFGDVQGARERYERAVAIPVNGNDPEELDDFGKFLSNFGHLLLAEGEFDKAWQYFESARQLHEQLHGRNHRTTAIDVHNLGLVRRAEGRFVEAELLFEQALEMLRLADASNTSLYATTLINLATVLFPQDERDRARAGLEQAITIRESISELGAFHPDVIDAISAFAGFLEGSGNLVEARSELDRAIRLSLSVFGRRHDVTQSLLRRRIALESILPIS